MSTTTAPSSNRRLVLPALALIALSVFVHACSNGSSSDDGGGGGPAPSPGPGPSGFVSTSQVPADSATNVPLLPVIYIAFNDNVNTGTLTGNITLTAGAVVVPSTVTVTCFPNRVQLVPNVALFVGTPYTVNLTAGVLDDDGEALTPLTRSFTTTNINDTVRPAPSAAAIVSTPGDNIDPGLAGNQTTMMTLDWDDATDVGNPAASLTYRIYMSTNGCFDFGSPIASTSATPGMTTVVVPGLVPRTAYEFVVRAVDPAGNESQNVDIVAGTTFTSYLQNVYPLVVQNCANCHNPPSGQAWVNSPSITMDYSTSGSVYSSWISVPPSWTGTGFAVRVEPGDAAASFLWNKINATPPAAGVQMPWGLPPMSAANQLVFFDWIEQGALNN